MTTKNDNLREQEVNKLRSYLKNPGYFSILVLGDSGTGKEYIINQLILEKIKQKLKDQKDEENFEKMVEDYKTKIFGTYSPYEIGENDTDIEEVFDKEIILIKNIEELSDKQQNIIFKALSTKDGKIGLSKNKGLKRIIFTSTFDVIELRDSKEHLSDRFWDRVSQLVVKFPSFKDFSSNILEDFKSVWNKMSFKEYKKIPQDGEFQYWLKENSGTFAGNFRDLDKIAILWHQYRLIEYSDKKQEFKSDVETRIFRKVRFDFEKFTHFPTQQSDTRNTFKFEKGKTWEQIERNFKSKFKQWAKAEYGTIINATNEMNMPARKMDKW